jgi:hypothetical protein
MRCKSRLDNLHANRTARTQAWCLVFLGPCPAAFAGGACDGPIEAEPSNAALRLGYSVSLLAGARSSDCCETLELQERELSPDLDTSCPDFLQAVNR